MRVSLVGVGGATLSASYFMRRSYISTLGITDASACDYTPLTIFGFTASGVLTPDGLLI